MINCLPRVADPIPKKFQIHLLQRNKIRQKRSASRCLRSIIRGRCEMQVRIARIMGNEYNTGGEVRGGQECVVRIPKPDI